MEIPGFEKPKYVLISGQLKKSQLTLYRNGGIVQFPLWNISEDFNMHIYCFYSSWQAYHQHKRWNEIL